MNVKGTATNVKPTIEGDHDFFIAGESTKDHSKNLCVRVTVATNMSWSVSFRVLRDAQEVSSHSSLVRALSSYEGVNV